MTLYDYLKLYNASSVFMRRDDTHGYVASRKRHSLTQDVGTGLTLRGALQRMAGNDDWVQDEVEAACARVIVTYPRVLIEISARRSGAYVCVRTGRGTLYRSVDEPTVVEFVRAINDIVKELQQQ